MHGNPQMNQQLKKNTLNFTKQSKTFQYINIAQFSFENMSFSFTFLRTAKHTHSPTIQYLLVIHTGTNSFYTNAIITFNEHAL